MCTSNHNILEVSPTLRRSGLVILFALWTCFVVRLNPSGTIQSDSSVANYWPYAWIGGYTALPCLFAVWIALGTQPLTVRIPSAMGLAALLGLMEVWGQTSERRSDIDFLLLSLSVTCLDALMLGLLRRRYGWEIRRRGKVAQPWGPVQFTIFKLLLWTTATALLLALANLAVSDWNQVAENLRTTKWLGAIIGVLILSALSLPLVVSGVGFVLADGRQRRFGVVLAIMMVFVLLLTCLVIFVAVLNSGRSFTLAESAGAVMIPVTLLFSFLSALLGNLLLLRLCGYRMG